MCGPGRLRPELLAKRAMQVLIARQPASRPTPPVRLASLGGEDEGVRPYTSVFGSALEYNSPHDGANLWYEARAV